MTDSITSPRVPTGRASSDLPQRSEPHRSEHGTLPLPPRQKPQGLVMRLLFRAMRRRYGRVPTAFGVVYARAPALVWMTLGFAMASRWLRIGAELSHLLRFALASRMGCTFCADLTLAEAMRGKIGRERFACIQDFETAACFDERARAALHYAETVYETLRVPDEVFERLKRSFDEREVVEIVWLCAVERYFNGMALPLRIGSDELAPPA